MISSLILVCLGAEVLQKWQAQGNKGHLSNGEGFEALEECAAD